MTFVTLPHIVLRYLAAEDAAAGLLNALGAFCSGGRPRRSRCAGLIVETRPANIYIERRFLCRS